MRGRVFYGVVILAPLAAVTVLWFGSAASPVTKLAAARVQPRLEMLLERELSRQPLGSAHALTASPRVVPRLPRSATGWSCPVSTGSPCGRRSHRSYLPLAVAGTRTLTLKPAHVPGAAPAPPTVNFLPAP